MTRQQAKKVVRIAFARQDAVAVCWRHGLTELVWPTVGHRCECGRKYIRRWRRLPAIQFGSVCGMFVQVNGV